MGHQNHKTQRQMVKEALVIKAGQNHLSWSRTYWFGSEHRLCNHQSSDPEPDQSI